MKGFVSSGLCLAPLALLVLAVGCQDPKKQIDQLTRELQQTQADLHAAQGERDQAQEALRRHQQENQGLSSQLTGMQSTIGELEQRLAAAQKAAAASPHTEGGWVVAPGVSMLSIQAELLFDSGRAELKPAGRSKIADAAREIRNRYRDRDIYVIGHTDTDPIKKSKWRDNWELSAERALTVGRSLIQGGVTPRKVMVAGCGEYRPVGSTKAKNRRVEIYAVVPAGPGGSNRAAAAD